MLATIYLILGMMDITFCNKKEENGWKKNIEWFNHVKKWAQMKNEEDENPITYTIKEK